MAENKLEEVVLGKTLDPSNKDIFHKLTLVAFLAWVGLGADGLSSAAYGPPEAYRSLGAAYHHISIFLALATAVTVFIISASYNQIIEHFPNGGGGYVVASKLLSPMAGLFSGCALLVDYILDISISIAAGVDAISSFAAPLVPHKLAIEVVLALLLIWLNLRGIKESIKPLLPIFILFVLAHALLIGVGLWGRAHEIPGVFQGAFTETHQIVSGPLGLWGFLVIFFTAYSLGGGTYTGLEAVSNGMANLREPRIKTGQRTMLYMAVSLSLAAGGILFLYVLWDVQFEPNKTLNTSLANAIFGSSDFFGGRLGQWLSTITILSEGLLLFIAAQTGFIDGPNVMANLAGDSWLPQRFASLSHQLVRMNGVLFMGGVSLALLLLSHGNVDFLIILFSINVFITFNLSQLSMCIHWWRVRHEEKGWRHKLFINGLGFCLTTIVLTATLLAKFMEGGFITLLITGALIGLCILVKRHYRGVQAELHLLDDQLAHLDLPAVRKRRKKSVCKRDKHVAVMLVDHYNGLGVHAVFAAERIFDNRFKDFLFVSIARVDSGKFKGIEEMENLKRNTEENLARYVELANRMGHRAEYRYAVHTDIVDGMDRLCGKVADEFSNCTFFIGKLLFAKESLWTPFLHNHSAMEIQRRLVFKGDNVMVLPVKVNA
jgi:amino acid transporter